VTRQSNTRETTSKPIISGSKHRYTRFISITVFRLSNPYNSNSPQTGTERAGIIVTRSECDVTAQRAAS